MSFVLQCCNKRFVVRVENNWIFLERRKTMVRMVKQMKRATSLILIGLVGCATPLTKTVETIPSQENVPSPLNQSGVIRSPGDPMKVLGVTLENTNFDFPVSVNDRVTHWVKYFTGKGRRHFVRYLERSEYFIPYIQPILKENDVPMDLVYLAMIESGFNNHARSRAAAVGPWQFIRGTGKRFGLKVNWWVDERRDIAKSTAAAVLYLKRLYQIYGSWELAAASYNAGEAKIARAIRRYGTKNFWSLSRHRYLKSETRNYVPKIMAAALISKNRTQFGFPERFTESEVRASLSEQDESSPAQLGIVEDKPEEPQVEESTTSLAAVLVEDDDDDSDLFQSENSTPLTTADLIRKISSISSVVPLPHVTRKGDVGGQKTVEFEVKGPADLWKIAKAADLEYSDVKRLNPEILRWCTPPHLKTYRIKLPASAKNRFLTQYNNPEFSKSVEFRRYKVRKGDTLGRIARRFGISIYPIKELNGIRSSRRLRVGKSIRLPLPGDRTQSYRSLGLAFKEEKKNRTQYKKSASFRKRSFVAFQ